MRVIVSQHFADSIGAFASGIGVHIAGFVHGIQHTAMNRLESVADIRQSSGDDHRHRIVDVGGLHFLLDADVNNSVFSISHFLVLCYGESAGSVN